MLLLTGFFTPWKELEGVKYWNNTHSKINYLFEMGIYKHKHMFCKKVAHRNRYYRYLLRSTS